jgi:flagellar protein FliO/FliZ
MLDSLFEGSAFKMLLVRWFGRERPTNAGRRGRRARLAVVEAANVDGRRKLVLIRRDNLEHLVLIGGPSDVLIEPNIAAGAAPREVPPPRPVPTGDTLRRAVPLGEGNMWPLQPERGPRPEPLPRPEPQPVRPSPPATEPAAHWPPREPGLSQSPRAASPRDLPGRTDPPSGLSEELGRAASASEPKASDLPVWLTTRREPRLRPASSVVTPPAPAPATDAKLGPSADQNNLANTAQRFEAVMRRPVALRQPRTGDGQLIGPLRQQNLKQNLTLRRSSCWLVPHPLWKTWMCGQGPRCFPASTPTATSTATALGIDTPRSCSPRADEVIE